jgi:tRNA pseudouridine38-40 synthase
MNSRLPEDIRVMKASYAKPDFDARKDAKGKEYRYFLYNADILPPCLAPYWAFMHKRLDVAAMQDAAHRFVGRHDFAPFAANPHRVLETTVRNIFSFEVEKVGPRITFIVRGDGFLYKQVRSMVGFLIRVGLGEERPCAVTELLDGHVPRTARVPTATGRGLFLWKVFYR